MELASEDIEQVSDDAFFVGASPIMRKLRAQAELLAQANVPVLILGENGSGKDTAARLIHKLSVRSGFKFLKVNCAALPGDLLETELFGYERSDSGVSAIQTRQTRTLCARDDSAGRNHRDADERPEQAAAGVAEQAVLPARQRRRGRGRRPNSGCNAAPTSSERFRKRNCGKIFIIA